MLLGGDILIEAFGQAIGAPDGIEKVIAAAAPLQPDSTVRVRLVRAGKLLQLEAKLSELVPGSRDG